MSIFNIRTFKKIFTETYVFIIENTNIVRFSGMGAQRTLTARAISLKAQSINEGATTTVTLQGLISGLVATISISVIADPTSGNPPGGSEEEWNTYIPGKGKGGKGGG